MVFCHGGPAGYITFSPRHNLESLVKLKGPWFTHSVQEVHHHSTRLSLVIDITLLGSTPCSTLTLPFNLYEVGNCYPHFTHEEGEAQNSQETCPR